MANGALIRSTAPLSAAEARALTDRIRSTAEDLASLLQEAYERQAWRALGYASWREYATTELSISQSHAYRLLDHAKVVAAIQEAAGGVSPMGEITERQSRELKPHLEDVTGEIRERVDAGEDPEEAVREVVAETRAGISKTPEPEPEEEAHPEYGAAPEVDVEAELAHALEENRRLQAALDATEQGTELRQWIEKYARLEGRLQQEMRTAAENAQDAKRRGRVLKEIRGVLGVESDREILPRLREVLG